MGDHMTMACLSGKGHGKNKSGDMSILHHSKLLFTFPFLQKSNEEKPHPSALITTKASSITVPA